MNRVYLFGKLVYKSKLKYNILTKLNIYTELVIETSSGDMFQCIIDENNLDKVKRLNTTNFVYIIGSGFVVNDLFYVIVKNIWIFS